MMMMMTMMVIVVLIVLIVVVFVRPSFLVFLERGDLFPRFRGEIPGGFENRPESLFPVVCKDYPPPTEWLTTLGRGNPHKWWKFFL
jgi:hypothetical protein